MDKIHLVSSTNDKYLDYLCAMLVSLAENSSDCRIEIHILYENLSNINKKILSDLVSKYTLFTNLKFWKIDKDYFENAILKTYSQVSYEAYSRLLIPDILKNVDKVIYLDADIIVLKDIRNLNKINIDNFPIAAVEDFNNNSKEIFSKIFNLKNTKSYFNSGVLIMNLKKLREINFTKKSLKLINETKIKYNFFDQDILNLYFANEYKKIDPRWNVQLYLELATSNFQHSTLNEVEYLNCRQDPFIIHYTIVKPDYYNYFFKYKNIYKDYLKKSGLEFKIKKTPISKILWTILEISFFKFINLFNIKSRKLLLDYFRKFFL